MENKQILQIRMHQIAVSTMLKNKAELSDEGRGSWGGGVIWDKAIVESSQRVMFIQRPKGGERVNHEAILSQSENSQRKDPEVNKVECWRNIPVGAE